MKPLATLVLLGLLAFVFSQRPSFIFGEQAARPNVLTVEVYLDPTQAEGWEAERFFRARGLRVHTRDIMTDADAHKEYIRRGRGPLPMILIGNERLDGFRDWEAQRLLDRIGVGHP
jgi:hypothetical protein